MRQRDKIDLVLQELYSNKHDGNLYSIQDILIEKCNSNGSLDEATDIGNQLEDAGYIQLISSYDTIDARIIGEGIDYVEDLLEKKQDDEIVRKDVKRFYIGLDRGQYMREESEFIQDLDSNLYEYEFDDDKIIFLDELSKMLKSALEKHLEKYSQNNSRAEEFFRKAIFTTKRKKQSLEAIDFGSIGFQPDDPVSSTDEDKINQKLDEVLSKLQKLELGQEIIYDHIEERIENLRELIPIIGQKSIDEIFKGILLDLAIKNILDVKALSLVYKTFTGEDFPLLSS